MKNYMKETHVMNLYRYSNTKDKSVTTPVLSFKIKFPEI